MPPVTTSPAPVIAPRDSKESGVTKVIRRHQSAWVAGCGQSPREARGRLQPEQLGLVRTGCLSCIWNTNGSGAGAEAQVLQRWSRRPFGHGFSMLIFGKFSVSQARVTTRCTLPGSSPATTSHFLFPHDTSFRRGSTSVLAGDPAAAIRAWHINEHSVSGGSVHRKALYEVPPAAEAQGGWW